MTRIINNIKITGICLCALAISLPLQADDQDDSNVIIFNVSDFGARGDGRTDDRTAIQKTIQSAIDSRKSAIVKFEEGKVYRLAAYDPGNGMLIISNAENITLDGNSATLLSHPSNRILAVFMSKNITVKDLYLDYSPLPFTQGRMHVVSPEEGYVEFKVSSGYDAPVIGGSEIYQFNMTSDCNFIRSNKDFTHSWLRIAEITQPQPGIFRCRFHGKSQHVARQLKRTSTEDYIVIKMKYPQGEPLIAEDGSYITTLVGNISIKYSEGVTLKRITSYAAPYMTFNASGSEAVNLEDCAIIRKPGTDRLIAGQSDGCHIQCLTTMPNIINCHFEALMDDSIATTITGETVEEIIGNRIYLDHSGIRYNDTVINNGDELELYDNSEKKHLGFAKVIEIKRIKHQKTSILLDNFFPDLEAGDRVYLKPKTPLIIRGCTFDTQLKTGIYNTLPGIIENCTFNKTAYGIHTSTFGDWPGGGQPRELIIKNCTFANIHLSAIAWAAPSKEASPPAKFSLKIEDSHFDLGDSKKNYFISGANSRHEIILKNNTATTNNDRRFNQLFKLHNCNLVDRSGNTVQKLDE